MALDAELINLKSAGTYRFERDKSGISNDMITISNMRLIVGFSKVGPFNTVKLVTSTAQFIKLYGNIDRSLEKRGSFFHRSALVALSAGPILCLNLLNLDADVDQVVEKSFSTNLVERNSNAITLPLQSLYNTDKFWYASEEAYLDSIKKFLSKNDLTKSGFSNSDDENWANNILHITNISKKPLSVLIKKASDYSSKGYNLTLNEWYGEGEVPEYLNGTSYVKDYMVEVYVVSGDFGPKYDAIHRVSGLDLDGDNISGEGDVLTEYGYYEDAVSINDVIKLDSASKGYKRFASDVIYQSYFDDRGFIRGKNDTNLSRFLNLPSVAIKAKYVGSLIPNFIDKLGRNIWIQKLINDDVDTVGLLCAEDVENIESVNLDNSFIDEKLDLIGHNIFDKIQNNPSQDLDIKLLSYNYNYTEKYPIIKVDGIAYTKEPLCRDKDLGNSHPTGYPFVWKRTKEQDLNMLEKISKGEVDNTNVLTMRETLYTKADDASEVKVPATDAELEKLFTKVSLSKSNTFSYSEDSLTDSVWTSNTISPTNEIGKTAVYSIERNLNFNEENKKWTWTYQKTPQKMSFIEKDKNKVQLKRVTEYIYAQGGDDFKENVNYPATDEGKYKLFNEVLGNNEGKFENNDGTFTVWYASKVSPFDQEGKTNVYAIKRVLTAVDVTKNDGHETEVKTDPHAFGKWVYSDPIKIAIIKKPVTTDDSDSDVDVEQVPEYLYSSSSYVVKNDTVVDLVGTPKLVDEIFIDATPLITEFTYLKQPEDKAIYYTDNKLTKVYVPKDNEVIVSAYANIAADDYLLSDVYSSDENSNTHCSRLTKVKETRNLYAANTDDKKTVRYKLVICADKIYKDARDTKNELIVKVTPIDDICDRLEWVSLPGFKMSKKSMPDGTNERQDEILDLLREEPDYGSTVSNLYSALIDRDYIQFRYLVDTFGLGLEEECKDVYTKVCMGRKSALAIINCPSQLDFKKSADPMFTNKLGGVEAEYISTGGDRSKNPSFLFSLPTIDHGASWGAYYYPYLRISDLSAPKSVPPAAYVSNLYIQKYNRGFAWSIVAGQKRGVISGNQVIGVEATLLRDNRDFLEPMGINSIIWEQGVGVEIYGDKTAKQTPVSALSSIHAREAAIYIQDGVESILRKYVFEFNTAQTRLEIKTLVDNFLDTMKSNGGVYDYKTVMDTTNNTEEVIDNNRGVIDIYVEIVRGLEIIAQRLTILRTGAIAAGGFE